MSTQNDGKQGGAVALGIVCAIASVVVGAQEATGAWITMEFGEGWYHTANALMGFGFAVSLTKFFRILGRVIEIAGALAWFLVLASISLAFSSAYLALQFYRVYVW